MFVKIGHRDFGRLWHHPKIYMADKKPRIQGTLVTHTVSFQCCWWHPAFCPTAVVTAFCLFAKWTLSCQCNPKIFCLQISKYLENKVNERNIQSSQTVKQTTEGDSNSLHVKEKKTVCLHSRQLRKGFIFAPKTQMRGNASILWRAPSWGSSRTGKQ